MSDQQTQAQQPRRPLPDLQDPVTNAFWSATREHSLTYQTCDRCDGVVFGPRSHCPVCGGIALTRRVSSGRGIVYTVATMRQHSHPFFRARLPYVVGYVDLEEGFRVMAEIIAADPSTALIGQPVAVEWEDHDECSVPLFRITQHEAERTPGLDEKEDRLERTKEARTHE